MSSVAFSAVFRPTALFSLKNSSSTNSGAKSLFLPSPYAVKMAILNQAITVNNIDFEANGKQNKWFEIIRDLEIGYFLQGSFCVNKCFIKILKPSRSSPGEVQETVSFREYIHITEPIEIICRVKNEIEADFVKKYLFRINYFGKRGCFFQFCGYKDTPSEPNVHHLGKEHISSGILQEYDDFGRQFSFEYVNNFGGKISVKRHKHIFILPLQRNYSSKGYTNYRVQIRN